MVERSVFVSKNEYPYVEEIKVETDAFGGMELTQKLKYEMTLHKNFDMVYSENRVLEISSVSKDSLGKKLSAMNQEKEGYTAEERKEAMHEIIAGGYTAFVDLIPVSLNSPARSCAFLVGLYRAGLLDEKKTLGGSSYDDYFILSA